MWLCRLPNFACRGVFVLNDGMLASCGGRKPDKLIQVVHLPLTTDQFESLKFFAKHFAAMRWALQLQSDSGIKSSSKSFGSTRTDMNTVTEIGGRNWNPAV